MDEQAARVAVVGQGALGTYFAVLLAEVGHPVTVISSRAEQRQRVELSLAGRRPMTCEVERAPSFPAAPVQHVILATRAADAVPRARDAVEHLADGGLLSPVQNGLVPLDVCHAVGAHRAAPIIVGFNAKLTDPATVEVTSPGGVTLGPLPGTPEAAVNRLHGSLQRQMAVKTTGNPEGAVWSKWTISCAINGLAVVTGEGVGPLSRRKPGRVALIELVSEGVALAQAEEVALERVAGPLSPDTLAGRATGGLGGWFRQLVVRMIGRRYQGVVPSSLDALRAGRDTELDELAGRAVDLGEEHGVDVPWNRAVLEVGSEVVAGKRAPGWDALDTVAERARR